MLRLESLEIRKFRNVKPGTRLEFNPVMNVLLGKNATGKTTLLELISMCVRSDFSRLQEEEFDFEYVLSVGDTQLAVVVRNSLVEGVSAQRHGAVAMSVSCQIIVSGGVAVPPVQIRGSATGTEVLAARGWEALESFLAPLDPDYVGFSIWKAWDEVDDEDPRGQFLNTIIGSMDCYRFDEGLEAFSAFLGRVLSTTFPAASITHNGDIQYLPEELFANIDAYFARNPEKIDVTWSGRELKFLKDAVQTLGFHKGQLRAEVLGSSEGRVKKAVGNFRVWLSHKGESPMPIDLLSYGQKRLFAFIYYLHCNPEIVIADEMTNGMHHEWISDLVKRLEGRQSFLATQNPLLLDYLQFESPEQVRSTFVQCQLKKQRGKKPAMVWAPLEPEDAERFYRAYSGGGQYVSEILIVKGLW